jgi:hypothetical protein
MQNCSLMLWSLPRINITSMYHLTIIQPSIVNTTVTPTPALILLSSLQTEWRCCVPTCGAPCTATVVHPQLLPPTSIAPPFPNTTMNPTPKVRAPAVPIETLHTDAAKFYTHIHPVLVLSLYALRFNAIVADPVPALLRTLVPLAALQIAYVAICLPPTGGSTAIVEKKKPGEKKKVAERGLSRSIIVRLPCPCP